MRKYHTRVTGSIHTAAKAIQHGEIVAFPTETVYGLGANAFDKRAVKKIFEAKGRPADNPLIVHIYSTSQLPEIVQNVPPVAHQLITHFWPGPLSIVFKRNKKIPDMVTGGLPTVCVRMPNHYLAKKFLKKTGVPIAAPSANLSGKPSPTTWKHVWNDLNGKIPLILKGTAALHGIESTVVDCTAKTPRLLRPGVITLEQLQKIAGKINTHSTKHTASPGMQHQHYAPQGKVILINDPTDIRLKQNNKAYIGITPSTQKIFQLNPANVNQYARQLFSFFRTCDSQNISFIYAQKVSEIKLGRALMDRLRRATRDNVTE